ncbi:hypothetical protein KC660_03230 [Candidatus Dojkabacteria bacterium]|uniref:DUF2680 domain-containing protein n=1 Tax=Candidatus Dojkabacteria bacterium TaxID=2099670 RepID=A0A955RI50_9BACT|nr:hypothetical protein [Candidatus Dojkabacteria bacterium]
MNKKKTFQIAGVAVLGTIATLSLALGGGLLTSKTLAATTSGTYPTIIENLATKFNLNKDEVQQVFEDTKTQIQTDRLDNLVSDGTITEEQKQLVLDKQEEIKTKVDEINNKELTATERREAMDNLRDEIQQWEDDNNIPEHVLGPWGGMRGGRHGMMDRDGDGDGFGPMMGGGFRGQGV